MGHAHLWDSGLKLSHNRGAHLWDSFTVPQPRASVVGREKSLVLQAKCETLTYGTPKMGH